MKVIVEGQSIVTASEFLEVAAGFDSEPLDFAEEFTAGGLASREALESFLEDFEVASDTDQENADYYAELLRRMPSPLRGRSNRRAATRTLGVAA